MIGNHEMAKVIFRKAYNCALKFFSFRMNNNVYTMSEANYHLPRCLDHTLECFTDTLSNHEVWILRGMYTLNSLYPTGLSWKGEEFASTKSKYTDHDPKNLPKDICPHCCFSTKNKECHVHVFHEYCKARVKKVFRKYAKAMDLMKVKKVNCIIHNSALHYYNYCHFNIMTHMTYHLPPKCLHDKLKEYADVLAEKRSDYMESFREEKLIEWKDTNKVIKFISDDSNPNPNPNPNCLKSNNF